MGVLARLRRSSPQDDEPEWTIVRESRALPVRIVLAICTALVGSIATTPMTAQVQLPSVNLGETNFEDGFADTFVGFESEIFSQVRPSTLTTLPRMRCSKMFGWGLTDIGCSN